MMVHWARLELPSLTLTRKNLMVDAEALRRLAKRLDMNESETVRHAVECLLAEDEMMQAAQAIRRRGGLVDVFGRTTPESEANVAS